MKRMKEIQALLRNDSQEWSSISECNGPPNHLVFTKLYLKTVSR